MLGSSATFGPLIADISHWFTRRRGIAVAIAASGNYLAGAVWPPIVQHLIADLRLAARRTSVIGVFCLVTMLPLALSSTPRAGDRGAHAERRRRRPGSTAPLGLSPAALQVLLIVAGVACCVAMSMPQVHIVAYCGDLGYGAARGAQMLSLMLALRHRQPPAVRLHRPTASAACARCCSARSLQGLALVLFLPVRRRWPRSTWSRRCSGCSRAASCRATP